MTNYYVETRMSADFAYNLIIYRSFPGTEFPGEFHDGVIIGEGSRVSRARAGDVRGRGGVPQQQHRLPARQGTGAPGPDTQPQHATAGTHHTDYCLLVMT